MVPSIRPLELIPNAKSRKLTFRRRAMGLRKKTQELTTLCDIDACLIIYEAGKCNEAVLWAPNPEQVKSIINSCRQCNKKINVTSSKLRNQAADTKYPTWDHRLNNFSLDQLIVLLQKLEYLEYEIELQKIEKILLEEPDAEMPTFVPPDDQHGVSLLQEEPEVEMPTFMPADDQYGVSLLHLHQLYSDPSPAVMERRIFDNLEPPAACYCLQPMLLPNMYDI